MGLGRNIYRQYVNLSTLFASRPRSSPVLPDAYTTVNTTTTDSEMDLHCLSGEVPGDIEGSLFICQCLGSPGAYMVGDTNIVRVDLGGVHVRLTNRLMWTPTALARLQLAKTRYRFDFLGLMYLSPGLGMFSYTEGLYLLPDGRISVTSDIDRPWVIRPDDLRAVTPIGRREEWMPFMLEPAHTITGRLFSAYNNSHVIHAEKETSEVFLVNFRVEQPDGSHPVNLIRWDGKGDFESWLVVDDKGDEIEIKQSIHELVCTRDYVVLADTAFLAGSDMLTPWVNAPLPSQDTVLYVIARDELRPGERAVSARRLVVNEPCIHLVAEYENPDDKITVYMLHTPATNTAEILRNNDRDLDDNLFPEHLTGYGTLPVLDLSSVGKHVLDVKKSAVTNSDYIAEMPYTWGPYLYTYPGRQLRPFTGPDLFVMFKGFAKAMLPRRIFEAFKDVRSSRVPLEQMVAGDGLNHNNSICRISVKDFEIADAYVFPDRVLLYTICCIESSQPDAAGYVIAGVVTDETAGDLSSGHEYWLFKADDLAGGPVCKLGHPDLCNSTLFHTVYLPRTAQQDPAEGAPPYIVPIRQDFPEQEIGQWGELVEEAFRDLISPYFDPSDPEATRTAEQAARRLARNRVVSAGREPIIGEERISDAGVFAERMVAEAERMWHSTGWRVESDRDGVLVESKSVSGVFEPAGLRVTRGAGEIEASAQETFAMLVSPGGYAVIDPNSDPADHERPLLETYDWREGSRLEAAMTTTKRPLMPAREFVVLNAIDPAARIFASKSIIHDACPGASAFSNEPPTPGGKVRALNTFATKVETISDHRCRVLCISYVDMAGGTPALISNRIHTKFFFQPLYKRIAEAMRGV
jgi:hypothetical protein